MVFWVCFYEHNDLIYNCITEYNYFEQGKYILIGLLVSPIS